MYDKWQDTWYSDEKKLQSILQPSIQELLSVKVDGILYVAGHNRTINYFPEDFRIPVVIVYALSSSPKFPSVIIDDEKGGYDITKYLISMGHRRIGMIAGTMNNQHTRMRSLGFQKALFEERILFNPDWVRYGTWKRDSGYEETERLIQEGVSAIFCMNDYMAGGVYDYLYERDMVAGEDISLVGYDNNEISEYLKPALTTNKIQFKEIGIQSANLLIGMIEGIPEKANGEDNVGRIEKIPCHMVIRESVKRLP